MNYQNALREIAIIADEVFTVGCSQIQALEKIRNIAIQELNNEQNTQSNKICTCSIPAPIGIVFRCRQCQLPILHDSN